MKEHILQYLSNTKKTKKVIWAMKNESWYPKLEAEYRKLGIPADWDAQRKLWHYWHGTSEVPKCPVTGEDRKWRSGKATETLDLPHFNQGYAITAGEHAAGKLRVEKARETLKARYGVSNPMDIKGVKQKREQTFLAKYGVANPSSNEQVKQKRIKTMLQRYGVEHNFIDWQDKMESKHGVLNAVHIPEVAEKLCSNRFKTKHEYKLDSGEIIYLQGYETYGLDYLKKSFKEKDILYRKRDMPEVWYYYKDKKHRYYADFFIPSQNLVIEVKSSYTLARDYQQVQEKIQATNNIGYNLLLLVFEKNGEVLLEQAYKSHPEA